MTRELSAKVLEFLHIGREGTYTLLAIDTSGKDMAIGMDGARTTIVNADVILSHPVNADDEHLVLDGTSGQQRFPSKTTLLRPISHADQNVIRIVGRKPRPNRETQVEADYQKETNASPSDDTLLLPRLIATAFATNVEQMVFVVMMQLSLRGNEVTTIAVVLTVLGSFPLWRKSDGKRSTEGGLITTREIEQALLDVSEIFRLTCFWRSHESRAAHLGQHKEIGIGQLAKDRLNLLVIGLRVKPTDVLLIKGDIHCPKRRVCRNGTPFVSVVEWVIS